MAGQITLSDIPPNYMHWAPIQGATILLFHCRPFRSLMKAEGQMDSITKYSIHPLQLFTGVQRKLSRWKICPPNYQIWDFLFNHCFNVYHKVSGKTWSLFLMVCCYFCGVLTYIFRPACIFVCLRAYMEGWEPVGHNDCCRAFTCILNSYSILFIDLFPVGRGYSWGKNLSTKMFPVR